MRSSASRLGLARTLTAVFLTTGVLTSGNGAVTQPPQRSTVPAATVQADPGGGEAGTVVSISGAGYKRNTSGTVTLGSASVAARTDARGRFVADLAVPAGPAGALDVTARFGTLAATSTFTRTGGTEVEPPPPGADDPPATPAPPDEPVTTDQPLTTDEPVTTDPGSTPTAPGVPTSQTFEWSGHTWTTRSFQGEPAPHHRWDGGSENVHVDDLGRLHLRLTRPDGELTGAQLWTDSLGYGTYRWTIASPLDRLHPSVVLGLWTYDDDTPVLGNREIDIEFTRWGDPSYWNAWYNLHPQDVTGASHGYFLGPDAGTVHEWTWRPGEVTFRSSDAAGRTLGQHTYRSATLVPAPATEKVLMNLWVTALGDWRSAPETEIVVDDFTFTPLDG